MQCLGNYSGTPIIHNIMYVCFISCVYCMPCYDDVFVQIIPRSLIEHLPNHVSELSQGISSHAAHSNQSQFRFHFINWDRTVKAEP